MMDKSVVVIKSNIRLNDNDYLALYSRLLAMKNEGVILLPNYCDVVGGYVDLNVELEVENDRTQD